MKILAVIPARMASSRFPNKPMSNILGMPMIGHCYNRAILCKDLEDVYVATCDDEIFNYIKKIEGNVIMTSVSHERASDRAAEALIKIEKKLNKKYDIIVMLQGDEPMVTPEMITSAVKPLINSSEILITNLYSEINNDMEFNDPNEVKVVIDKNSNALYFSREPIPSKKKGVIDGPMYKQVCIIPFKRDFLLQYNSMDETILEKIESVDMMRILENGLSIKMIYTNNESYSVDTPSDLKNVINKMKSDNLLKKYL